MYYLVFILNIILEGFYFSHHFVYKRIEVIFICVAYIYRKGILGFFILSASSKYYEQNKTENHRIWHINRQEEA